MALKVAYRELVSNFPNYLKEHYMSEQRNLNSSDDQSLIQGRTGNSQLDTLFAEIANEPLVYSKEEAFNIVTTTVMPNSGIKGILTPRNLVVGAVIIAGLAGGLLWYSVSNSSKYELENSSGLFGFPAEGETSVSAMPESSADENPNGSNSSSNVNNSNSKGENSSNQPVGNKESTLNSVNPSSLNENNNFGSSTNRKTTATIVKNNNVSDNKRIKSSSAENESNQRSKTTVTQRFFVDGSAMVALDYNRKPAVITINPRGIEKLTIGNELIQAVDYPKYEALAIEAFQRAKIEPLSGATHDANAATDIPEIMIKALLKRGLIKENNGFEFVLTAASASLDNKVLSEDIQLDLLSVLKDASGKELPKNGRIRIKR